METELARKDPKQTLSPLELAVPPESSPLRKIAAVASIATGSQFCWALQFSLLTPYVQLLGIPHAWASLIWLCGPISGMVVQPIVGHHSDRSTSRFGRRSPFIAGGAASIVVAVLLIGYAADLGHLAGDKIGQSLKTRAIAIFVVGFWMLDVANNMLQGPCRALLADLSGCDQKKTRIANSLFSFFMAVGFFLGYAAGSYTHLYKMLPFTKTKACDVDCANLKTCFFIAIALLSTLTIISLTYVKEKQWSSESEKSEVATEAARLGYFRDIYTSLKSFNRPMWILLLVMCLTSTAFFPLILYDTDWMGREVYGGNASGSAAQVKIYNRGVHAGAVGLMLSAVVLGFTSLNIEILGRKLGNVKRVWAIGNFVLATCLASCVLITKEAESNRKYATVNGVTSEAPLPPSVGIKVAALALFAFIGFPQAIILSVPFALASIFCNNCGAGQGFSLGILNLSIVIPQLVLSLTAGPFDALFGGGNLPAFVVAAIAAATSGILVLAVLPSPPQNAPTKATTVGVH